MVRVTLSGSELVGLERGAPASSVRLLLPGPQGLVLPTWNGNEFLDADGSRPRLRTLTPLAVRDDGQAAELDVDVVLHDDSPLSSWVRTVGSGDGGSGSVGQARVGSGGVGQGGVGQGGVGSGDQVAISGTGAGYEIDPTASSFLLLGDESAIPAICVLMGELPAGVELQVHLELRDAAHTVTLPERPGAQVHWHVAGAGAPPGESLVAAVEAMTAGEMTADVSTAGQPAGEAAARLSIDEGTRIWAAGEAAAVQRIRKLLAAADVPRSHAVVRGYWKVARS